MTQTETTLPAVVILPEEVQAIALKVSDEKRAEVNNVLMQIFSGTADWKNQVDAIVVKDQSDKLGMDLAKTARLNAKNARLTAEKIFDQRRDEVQNQMLSFQTEDKLWLKSKQTMQILFKEIESMAEYKEKTAERFEAEQHELQVQIRMTKITAINPEITRQEVEWMSEASFDALLSGMQKAKEDAEKAEKAEQENQRLAELRKQRDQERFKTFAGTGYVFSGGTFAVNEELFYDLADLCELDDDAFAVVVQDATDKLAECKAAEVKEKERLRIIAEAKEKELAAQEAEMLKQKAEADAKQKEIEEAGKLEREKAAEALRVIQEKAALDKRAQDEIIAKQNAEIAAQKKAEESEKLSAAKRAAESLAESERLSKAPRKEKLTVWIDSLVALAPVGTEEDLLVQNILAKFDGFKKWAKLEVEKL